MSVYGVHNDASKKYFTDTTGLYLKVWSTRAARVLQVLAENIKSVFFYVFLWTHIKNMLLTPTSADPHVYILDILKKSLVVPKNLIRIYHILSPRLRVYTCIAVFQDHRHPSKNQACCIHKVKDIQNNLVLEQDFFHLDNIRTNCPRSFSFPRNFDLKF